MGAAGSKLEKALGDQFPEGERYFGLENFGNTCYCNSVLQVFAPVDPFRLCLSCGLFVGDQFKNRGSLHSLCLLNVTVGRSGFLLEMGECICNVDYFHSADKLTVDGVESWLVCIH